MWTGWFLVSVRLILPLFAQGEIRHWMIFPLKTKCMMMRRDENYKFCKYGLYQPIIQTVLWLMRIGYWLFSTSISYRNLRSPLSGDCKFHLTLVRTFDQFSLFIGQFWINDTVSTFGFFGLHEFFYEARVIFGYFCIILWVCQFSKFLVAQRVW